MKDEFLNGFPILFSVSLICAGVYLIYPPASLIVLGSLLLPAALKRGNK